MSPNFWRTVRSTFPFFVWLDSVPRATTADTFTRLVPLKEAQQRVVVVVVVVVVVFLDIAPVVVVTVVVVVPP